MTRTFAPAALVAAFLMLLPAAAQARVIQAETVLPPGQSGFVPTSGTNPHLTDQLALYQSFAFKPAGFNLPGTTETPFTGVTITRDAFGVPNVRAGNDADAWKGVGYAMAQDRLVQLELFRRATEGRLAEVLGADRLQDDIVARRDYYTPRELQRMLRRLPAQLRARFDAYAAGVNAWIAKVAADPSKRPLELAALNLTPAPWKPVDSAAIGVQLARTIPSGEGRELENWKTLRALGARRFKQMLPLRRSDQVATVPASAGRFPSDPGRTRKDERIGFKRSLRFLKTIKAPKAAAAQAARLIRGGSDAWAIRGGGNRSYLFHGPQLGFEIPEQLAEFEVHRPGLDARGVTPPGLPIVGIGRNDHIAWGDTSGSTDMNDLYAERLKGRERYVFKGRTRKMRCRTATFKVAGESDVKRRLCRTVHGPVQARGGKRTAFARRYATWGHEMSTLTALAQLNEADSVRAAARAIAKVSWNENTMVADDQGNIGWFHPGRLAKRPKRWDERLPFPGTGGAEWRGFLKVSQRPHVINPKQGWLANWNNVPSVGWTSGDAPDAERTTGRLHRAAYLFSLVRQAAKAPSFATVKAVDRVAGTHAQQRSLLAARLRPADSGASGPAKALLDTVLAWDGDYDTADASGTANPGVASWEALKQAARNTLPRAARRWLGRASASHQFDFGAADGVAFKRLSTAGIRSAAGKAAAALTARFGSADPARWREPRRMYDVTATGLAKPPALKFYDRGTWQEAYELGP
jgi:acyl-homoserine lactone acylase PvdQ